MGLELLGRMEKREKAPIALPFRETRPTFGMPNGHSSFLGGRVNRFCTAQQPTFGISAGHSHGNGHLSVPPRQISDGVWNPSWGGEFA